MSGSQGRAAPKLLVFIHFASVSGLKWERLCSGPGAHWWARNTLAPRQDQVHQGVDRKGRGRSKPRNSVTLTQCDTETDDAFVSTGKSKIWGNGISRGSVLVELASTIPAFYALCSLSPLTDSVGTSTLCYSSTFTFFWGGGIPFNLIDHSTLVLDIPRSWDILIESDMEVKQLDCSFCWNFSNVRSFTFVSISSALNSSQTFCFLDFLPALIRVLKVIFKGSQWFLYCPWHLTQRVFGLLLTWNVSCSLQQRKLP